MLILLLIVLVIILKILHAQWAGKVGEIGVASRLQRLDKKIYHVFNNLLISSGNRTSQIDHVIVSRYGIFVIETKNYKGIVSGSESSEFWTQNIYGNKYQLRNPIRQNYGHVIALRNLLADYKGLKFVSIVAFSNRSILRVTLNHVNVLHYNNLVREIKKYTNVVMTDAEAAQISRKIEAALIKERGSKREHVKNIKADVKHNRELINSGICPKCGGQLVERHGRYGSFYGCSNYPKCRFTIK